MSAVLETMKTHIAILPGPGMGHIIPSLEFAKRLVIHHGFHVSILVITTDASAAQTQLLQSSTFPSDLQVINLPPADVSEIVHVDMPILTRISLIVKETLPSLKQALVDLNFPKALIIDMFCTDAIEICRELSIPNYTFYASPASVLAFQLYFPTLDRDVECEFVDLQEPIQVPGCTPVRIEDLVSSVLNRKNEEYKWYLLHVSRLTLAAGIFVNTWEDLEPVSLRALRENPFFKDLPTPPVYLVGPLIKEDEPVRELDYECLTWLDNQPSESVLFVSLGSGGTLSSEQLTELAWGLEPSEQRFIWVVRKPSDASVSAAFFNAGPGSDLNDLTSYLPDGFLKRTQGVGLVVPSWAPQVAVLRHPSTGGFLSHCGWNSTLESIVHGVPMIAWPLFAEQRMNATMLTEEMGVAVRPVVELGKGVVGLVEIERVVRLVMEGEEGKVMRRKVRELKDNGLKALNYGGSSYDSFSHILQPRINGEDINPTLV